MTMLSPDRLFPTDPATRATARALHAGLADVPLICPHGHVEAEWFAQDQPFSDPTTLLVVPDHYVTRMLVSQGVDPALIWANDDPRAIWRLFAANYHLFAATPSRLWLDDVMSGLFGLDRRLCPANADAHYDAIDAALKTPAFRPRALFGRFGIEVLATTDSALDPLGHHAAIAASGWPGRVIPTYRPDAVIDPDAPDFAADVAAFCAMANEPVTWPGYLAAHRTRRAAFRALGATATDHGAPDAQTARHPDPAALFRAVLKSPDQAQAFRAHMLIEMAHMSAEDGMVMQLHAGSHRNHSPAIHARFGANRGFDIPQPVAYTRALKPLLDELGHHPDFTLILFTLDEGSYSRELAPLAGAYPCLRLGPAWWFHDSPEGIRRYRASVMETAGLWNTAGFNDDTRALCSIPARHDMSRRLDCGWLAGLIHDGRLDPDEGPALARLLAHDLARKAYKL